MAVRTSVSTDVTTTAPIVSEIEHRDTDVILDIIPRVNASGFVILDIIQEVSDVVATVVTGVPLLSEIPLLGNLFKATTDTTRRTELLVLLTPRVVRDRHDARAVTDELRQRLRGLVPLTEKIQ